MPAPFQLFNIADETATVDIRVVEGSSEEIAIDETVELDPTESHEYRDFERQAYRFHVSAFGNSLTEEWQVYPDERSQLSADIDRDEIEFNTSKA